MCWKIFICVFVSMFFCVFLKVLAKMKTISFVGNSGHVQLDENGDMCPSAFAFINYRYLLF